MAVAVNGRGFASPVDVGERVMVACGVCGLKFDASLRSARDYRAGRAEPRCMLHRRRRPRSSRTGIAEMRRWWLDRFTVEDCVQMGTAVASVLPTFQRHLALTGSVEMPTDGDR